MVTWWPHSPQGGARPPGAPQPCSHRRPRAVERQSDVLPGCSRILAKSLLVLDPPTCPASTVSTVHETRTDGVSGSGEAPCASSRIPVNSGGAEGAWRGPSRRPAPEGGEPRETDRSWQPSAQGVGLRVRLHADAGLFRTERVCSGHLRTECVCPGFNAVNCV